MNNMITAEVAAEKWGVTKRRVNQLCSSGKIPGAIKEGQSWVIPANAQRPIDKRKKKIGSKPDTNRRRLPLPVGISEYRLATERYYYIDKTMLIKEFLDEQPMVSLFTRPRRFGKTLNMDMLRVFFEKSEEDTSVYFQDKAIWCFGEYYSFLLVAGYLKAENAVISSNGNYVCEVSLPNKEIRTVCNKEILQKFSNYGIQSSAALIQEAIYSNDTKKLKTALHSLLLKSSSCFDTTKELFFHGLLLGICAMFDNAYSVSFNRDSGDGRYDLQLEPKKTDRPGIILELKSEKKCSPERLKELAQTALNQINENKYDTEMKRRGITTVIKYGVAFSGKNVEIYTE